MGTVSNEAVSPTPRHAAAFAAARLDELDRLAARATVPFAHDWSVDVTPPRQHIIDGLGVAVASGALSVLEFIAASDPRRVMDVARAGRRILRRHERCGTGSGYCEDALGLGMGIDGMGCPELLDLVMGWERHPDFDAAWAREML